MPRGSDDRRETTAGRAVGQSRRWRLPARGGRGRGAAADGDRRGRADRRWPARTLRRAHDLSQWLPGPGPGHTPRQPAAAHTQAAPGQLLPALPRAPQDLGEGPGGRDPGSLGRRRLDPTRGRPGAGDGAGISKSTVSKLCKDIDDRVGAFLDRPLGGEWPYLWLDATYLKQREGGRIVSVAAIIAVAANTEGKRE